MFGANVSGSFLNDPFGIGDLFGVTRGHQGGIILKVVEHQANRIPFEDFPGGKCVDA